MEHGKCDVAAHGVFVRVGVLPNLVAPNQSGTVHPQANPGKQLQHMKPVPNGLWGEGVG